MQFRQVDVYTKSEAIQVLVMRLSELGLNGFIIHDPADFEEFLENKEYNWDYVDDSLMGLKTVEPHITCYVQDNEQGTDMLSALGGTLDELKENDTDDFYGSLDVTIDCVREEDWANNWKQYYKPFTVGEKLIVKPSWEEVENTDGRKILEIDPASSFGTGQHHTTRLVMELLEKQIHRGRQNARSRHGKRHTVHRRTSARRKAGGNGGYIRKLGTHCKGKYRKERLRQ